MGRKAAGTRAVRRCEKVGMRFRMEPVVCCGKSDARAMGRKAARKEREGTAEIAAMVGDVCAWWDAMRLEWLLLALSRSLSSFRRSEPWTRGREDLLRAWAGGIAGGNAGRR